MQSKPSVFARIRPCSAESTSLQVSSDDIAVPTQRVSFSFTGVLNNSSQEECFRSVGPIVQSALSGMNATVLSYGQTGSGKTYTLLGSKAEPGVVPRTCTLLGAAMAADSGLTVTLSMVEIYGDALRDLLAAAPRGGELSIQRSADKGFHVAGAACQRVDKAEDLRRLIDAGVACRAVRSTGLNAESSRSHLLISIYLSAVDGGGKRTASKLCLADLAGSERQSKTGTQGVSLAEGAAINKSLSTLANVLTALSEGSAHVPFRESKLTRLLQDCLAGNALMTLIVCLSPDPEHTSETVSSLRFGSRAMGITNVVKVNRPESLPEVIAERDALVEQLSAWKAAAAQPRPDALSASTKASAQAFGVRTVAVDLAMALVAVLQTVCVAVLLAR